MKKFASLDDVTRSAEIPKWRMFDIGETIELKGIKFTLHEIGDQRIVLKFQK